jgi:hypothetical protein
MGGRTQREQEIEEAKLNRPAWTCARCGYRIKMDRWGFYWADAVEHSRVCYGWEDLEDEEVESRNS